MPVRIGHQLGRQQLDHIEDFAQAMPVECGPHGHTCDACGAGVREQSTRCTASELRGNVGENNPGAGQENFPLVVTNFSGPTCSIDGYPGVAFMDGSGKQLGPDPKRGSGSPTKITLAPGKSAWAGLSFGNPEVSGTRKATPAGILITPPDEKVSLKVDWTGGAVPVSSCHRTSNQPASNRMMGAGRGSHTITVPDGTRRRHSHRDGPPPRKRGTGNQSHDHTHRPQAPDTDPQGVDRPSIRSHLNWLPR
ncbi:DUF4232 domain-containing protein [Streptomyces mirabilis]|uniref:DUF4232 domain-containing protein n=1 Tax=Streptomyces mirabilis TaxID=68239 RepID=UPI003686A70F